ncbi:MAG: putative dehydrogenase [Limisphaerales bacterium]|jgi:predicted dehydrogenase
MHAANKQMRVAVIGHTGRGNFGHGLDTVWLKIPETEIVAASDPNEPGLAKELKKLKIAKGFSDYRKMLEEMRPDIVAVCPRHADQHRDMAVAAAEAGAKGIYIEKPFCRTPAEADEIVAACRKHGTRLAIAHRNRYNPTLKAIDAVVAGKDFGRLLEIRGRGKGDRRGGVEDLWVLGSHVLNLMQYFGGDPLSCSATLYQDGQRATKADIRTGGEGLGLMAGNELHARYEFSKGVIGTFDSIANDGTRNAGFGLQLIGSNGIINLQADRTPLAHLVPGNPFQPTEELRPWIPITTAGPGKPEANGSALTETMNHIGPARDLIDAIRNDRPPLCDIRQATWVVEMICAVLESHRQDGRAVRFPLNERGNPLAKF